MKAIIGRVYGPPESLEFGDIDQPEIGADEILVRVHASSVNPLDWHEVTGQPYIVRTQRGLRRPKTAVPGNDVAGTVVAVGSDAVGVAVGDEVFGTAGGAYAEYVRMRAARAVTKPAEVSFEQAAAVPVAGLTALQGLRDVGRVAAGQRVLVTGAGGGVGTFAIQLARHFGASVTGVCGTGNVDLVRSLGAEDVVDYTTTDWTATGQRYDLIVDTACAQPIAARRRALTPRGTLVVIGGPKTNRWVGPLFQMLRTVARTPFVGQRLVGMLATIKADDLALLIGLVAAGTVTPAIGRTCPLPEVPRALARVSTGHAHGKTVITV